MKTSELTGAALDWAVAKCEERNITGWRNGFVFLDGNPGSPCLGLGYCPSTDWAQGGPIIERERLTVVCAEGDYNQSKSGTAECYDTYWVATIGRLTADTVYDAQGDDWGSHFQVADCHMQGPTPLIAAMRCLVASKLGDEIEIPKELK